MPDRQPQPALPARLPAATVLAGAALLGLLAAAPCAHAQMHRVEQPQRVTRAVGVYEWTGPLDKPTAARLVPVSLFINGCLEDAGVYLARPVPFALDEGVVYSVESAGAPLGTLDLLQARDVVTHRALADDDPLGAWYAYGQFKPPPPPPPLAALHPTAHPSVIVSSNDSDDTPHFVVRNNNDTPAPAASKPGTSAPGSSAPSRTSAPESSDDSERPTLRRRDADPDASHKKEKKQKPAGYVTGPADSLNDDPDRPILHRTEPGEAEGTPQLTGLPAGMQQTAAVSDAANRDEHVFTREWESPEERSQTLAALQVLARARVAAYLTTNHLHVVPPSAAPVVLTPPPVPAVSGAGALPAPEAAPAAASTAMPEGNTAALPPAPGTDGAPSLQDHTDHSVKLSEGAAAGDVAAASPAAKAPATARVPAAETAQAGRSARTRNHKPAPVADSPLYLTAEGLRGYELTYDGPPTFVYSAQTPVAEGGPVYLMLVAQRMPSGQLQVALSSVTDAGHLDRTPWLRLVDAVDPDWSHRADLLFELRGKSSRQFALYRLVTAQAEQTFVTGLIE